MAQENNAKTVLRKFCRMIIVAGIGILSAGPLLGATYTWTDKKGVLHMTDDISKVPPEQRKAPVEPVPAPAPVKRRAPYPPPGVPAQSGPVAPEGRTLQPEHPDRGTRPVFAGSWIAQNLGSYGKAWALQLDENGRGFTVGSDERAVARLTWRETDRNLAEIEVVFSQREKQTIQLIYDRPTDGMRMEPGSLRLRRMSRALPPLVTNRSTARSAAAGLWARKLDIGPGSNGFFDIEPDGTGMFIDRLPGGHAFTSVMTSPNNFHLTVVPGGRQYAELSPEQIKGLNKAMYMTYDPETDTIWMTESTGGNGATLFRIGSPLATAGSSAGLDTVAGLKQLADGGSASAALVLSWAHANNYAGKRDAVGAAKWVRHAADLGNANAQCILGVMLYQGRDGVENKPEGLAWLKRSAAQGYFYASVFLDEIDHREHRKQ